MRMSQSYGAADREESERALHRALDVGYTLLDTASLYGMGHNETLIGEVLKKRRHEFTLSGKCGILVRDGQRVVDGSPASIVATCEASLRRLQTDVIDLYYLHRRDMDVPIEESVGALSDLVRAWVLAQDENFVPIPGTKHVRYVEENAAAAQLHISAADLQQIGRTIDPGHVHGDRYAPSQMISLDPDQ